MLRSGDNIGPYTLVHQLGRGAFSIVWLAEKRTAITTTEFALKIAIDEEPNLDAIRQEANLWKQAGSHPNVLRIIEADIYDGYVVIVSEYAPHGSLDTLLKRPEDPPTIARLMEIVSGILAGLDHLHSQGIIHRDLKPANILFQGATPRLTDFGMARVLKTNTYSATVAGTPAFMAPEAFDGKRSVQTDIWAAGVILYRLVTGRLPYPQSDLITLIAAIRSREPESLSSTIPQPIQEIVTRALAKNPEQRYKSAAEMRKALLAISQFSGEINHVDQHTLQPSVAAQTSTVILFQDNVEQAIIVRSHLEEGEEPEQFPIKGQTTKESKHYTLSLARWVFLASIMGIIILVLIGVLKPKPGTEPTVLPPSTVTSDSKFEKPNQADDASPADDTRASTSLERMSEPSVQVDPEKAKRSDQSTSPRSDNELLAGKRFRPLIGKIDILRSKSYREKKKFAAQIQKDLKQYADTITINPRLFRNEEGCQIRYNPGFEDAVANELEGKLKKLYPNARFRKRPILTDYGSYISLFLGSNCRN